jgi:tRNA threonylcarbamoyladenosine biosynthesis protein TsaB
MFFRFDDAPRGHTRLLLPMVDQVLSQASVTLTDIDAIAFSEGPGSFTGLRIGFGVAQGLAFGANIPVAGVSSLEVLACLGRDKANNPPKETLLSVMDARMGEVYWALYRNSGESLEVIFPPAVSSPEQVIAKLSDLEIDLAVGSGWILLANQGLSATHAQQNIHADARVVARLALSKVAAGDVKPVEQAQLLYLRDEVAWKKRELIRQR